MVALERRAALPRITSAGTIKHMCAGLIAGGGVDYMIIDTRFFRALVRFQSNHLERLLIEKYGDLSAFNQGRIFRFIGAA